jgi:hypothetical protein
MKKVSKAGGQEVSFARGEHRVVIRTKGDRVTLEIDGTIHEVRFLDNGRPYTDAFVTVEAKDVRDYAERFIDFTTRQQAHWDELAEDRDGGGS